MNEADVCERKRYSEGNNFAFDMWKQSYEAFIYRSEVTLTTLKLGKSSMKGKSWDALLLGCFSSSPNLPALGGSGSDKRIGKICE